MGLGYPVCLQLHRNYGFQSCQYPLTVNAKLFIWLVINIISQASEEAGADFILARYMCISFSATFFFFSLPLLSVFEYLYITKKRWIQSKVFDGATAKRAILKLLIFSINIKKKGIFRQVWCTSSAAGNESFLTQTALHRCVAVSALFSV